MIETKLGKIKSAHFGWGGYQEVMFGFTIIFEGEGWGVGDFHGPWGEDRRGDESWTEADQKSMLAETCLYLRGILTDAKVQSVEQLVGIPVEVTFDGTRLASWRILKEVL